MRDGTAGFPHVKRSRARVVKMQREERHLRAAALAVVQRKPRCDRRQQCVAHLARGRALRIGNGAERRVEAELQFVGLPPIGAPAITALDLIRAERPGLFLQVLLFRPSLDEKRGGRIARVALIKRQTSRRGIAFAVAVFDANVNILIPRLSNLQPHAPPRAKVAAGEAHESAHRRMLGVEADIARKRL